MAAILEESKITSRRRKPARLPLSRPAIQKRFLTNRQLAELLAREADEQTGHVRRAFLRASRAAFLWPKEAAQLVAERESLQTLPGIGPFLEKRLLEWVEKPPEVPEPDELRRNFLTLTEAKLTLESAPDWHPRLHGDLQMHTRWSDGSGTVMDMAMAAERRGYDFISITDHTKGLKIAGGISEETVSEQGREIARVNAQLEAKGAAIRVLRSVEMNLNPQGEGDMDRDCLGSLDIVLGSFHSALRKTEDQTHRYLAALKNPDLQILGHPRGRLYNYRHGLKADWHKVFATAARLDKAVEIDGYCDRQDLDIELLQIAREEGVRISFGSDAHHDTQLGFLDFSLAAALLARIPPDHIINFLSRDQLLAWVQSVRVRAAESS